MQPTCADNLSEPLLVTATSQWQVCDSSALAMDNATLACAALELVEHVCRASTSEAAAAELVNRLRSFLSADGVALGLIRSGCTRLVATAGTAEIHPSSELSMALQRALDCSVDGGAEHAKVSASRDSLIRLLGGVMVAHFPLRVDGGMPLGALVIWGRGSGFDAVAAQRFLRLSSQPIASALALWQRPAHAAWWAKL